MMVKRLAILCLVLPLGLNALAQTRQAAPPSPTKPPELSRDIDALPAGVQRMRARILEAARSGEVGALLSVIESNEMPPVFVRGPRLDPIAYLKARDADEGRETLALLVSLLQSPYARIQVGTPQEMFVWPGLSALDPRALTPEQKVDLYRLVSAAAFRESLARGRYLHHRLGIGPDGTWHYFLAGD